MADSVQIATLKRALELAGDLFELSLRVGAGMGSLRSMLLGEEAIDQGVFLRAVEYIDKEQHPPHRVRACDYHEGPSTRQ
jgi:hypothetical protein